MRALALARAIMVTSGRAVALRAVPLACGVGLASAIVFGGHGLPPSTVVAMLHGSVTIRLAFFACWTMLAAPAVRRAFHAPGTLTLRALRPPRMMLGWMLLGLTITAQIPWITLFACGSTFGDAAAAALLACAATTSLPGLVVSSALVAIDAPPALAILPALALAYFSTRYAWRNATEERGVVRLVWRTPAPIALALTYVAGIVRTARARLSTAAIFVAAGEGALALSLRNDPGARPVARALVVLAFPLSIACALLATPAVETEARLHALLRTTRTKNTTLALAMALAIATPSSAFAATAGTLVVSRSVGIASAGYALVIGSVVAVWARRASRAKRSSTFLLGVAGIAAVFTLGAAAC